MESALDLIPPIRSDRDEIFRPDLHALEKFEHCEVPEQLVLEVPILGAVADENREGFPHGHGNLYEPLPEAKNSSTDTISSINTR
jgi:hypothetical protein